MTLLLACFAAAALLYGRPLGSLLGSLVMARLGHAAAKASVSRRRISADGVVT